MTPKNIGYNESECNPIETNFTYNVKGFEF